MQNKIEGGVLVTSFGARFSSSLFALWVLGVFTFIICVIMHVATAAAATIVHEEKE